MQIFVNTCCFPLPLSSLYIRARRREGRCYELILAYARIRARTKIKNLVSASRGRWGGSIYPLPVQVMLVEALFVFYRSLSWMRRASRMSQ